MNTDAAPFETHVVFNQPPPFPECNLWRDDRVLRYFSLKPNESRSFHTTFNAAYLGRYYQPALTAEAMYDATRYARLKGGWVEVAAK